MFRPSGIHCFGIALNGYHLSLNLLSFISYFLQPRNAIHVWQPPEKAASSHSLFSVLGYHRLYSLSLDLLSFFTIHYYWTLKFIFGDYLGKAASCFSTYSPLSPHYPCLYYLNLIYCLLYTILYYPTLPFMFGD